ncbi:MAG: radical SAM protein, partial [Rectinema sp.]|nr:radical SAM protein [Rectinema sp.]
MNPHQGWLDLSWIDEFWARAGAYIFCREEDGVLILPPNRVYKINRSAAALIARLARGGSIQAIHLPSRDAAEDTNRFFSDLAALYRGEQPSHGTVAHEQYSFSFTRLPVLGEISLTYRCNNACRFCYAGCGSSPSASSPRRSDSALPETAHPERGTSDYLRIIDIFAEQAHIPFFSFTGGEPTLRDDLEALIAHAARRTLITNLVTNGTLIDAARAKALKTAGLGSAQVSIEGPNASIHDQLAGRPGAFEETCRGIAALQHAGIPTQTNTTITRANLSAVPQMPAFLETLGIRRFSMNLFIPTIPGPLTDELFVPYEEIGPVIEVISREARRRNMTFFWYSPTPFCTWNPIARGHGNKSCAAAD